jgi:hypothetical protein
VDGKVYYRYVISGQRSLLFIVSGLILSFKIPNNHNHSRTFSIYLTSTIVLYVAPVRLFVVSFTEVLIRNILMNSGPAGMVSSPRALGDGIELLLELSVDTQFT